MKDRAQFFGLDKTDSFAEFKEKYLKAAEQKTAYFMLKVSEALCHNGTIYEYSAGNAYIDDGIYTMRIECFKKRGV